jgi:hypothetical protein
MNSTNIHQSIYVEAYACLLQKAVLANKIIDAKQIAKLAYKIATVASDMYHTSTNKTLS